MKRLVFIVVSLVLLQFCSAQNYIVNGNFTQPSLITPPSTYEFTNSLTGWQSSAPGSKLQRGIGSVYNANWGQTNYVAELDGQFGNYVLSQTVELVPGEYFLSFLWAGRTNHIASSGIEVKWMGQSRFSAIATDLTIKQQELQINIDSSGTYILEFCGTGKQDTYGATIYKVTLQKKPIVCPIDQSTDGALSTSTTECKCKLLFYWNSLLLRCIIDCSKVQFNAGTDPNNINNCLCQSQPPRIFDVGSRKCIPKTQGTDCTKVLNSIGPKIGTDQCLCKTRLLYYPETRTCDKKCNIRNPLLCKCPKHYIYDTVSKSCNIYCFGIPRASAIPGVINKCRCELGYEWSNKLLKCNQKCGNGIKTQGEQCDDGNRVQNDGCSNICKIVKNNHNDDCDSSSSSSSSSSI